MEGTHYVPAPGDSAPSGMPPTASAVPQAGNVSWDSLTPSAPVTESQQAMMDTAKAQQQWSAGNAMWESFKHENMVGTMMQQAGMAPPDPNYAPTVAGLQSDPRLSGIDKSHYPYLLQANSDAEMGQRIDALKDSLSYQQKMAELGGWGKVWGGVASALDPAAWLLTAASPIAGFGAKFGIAGKLLGGALDGAAAGTGMALPAASDSPLGTRDSLMYAAAGGAAFGILGSPFIKPHPSVAEPIADIGRAAYSVTRDIDARYAPSATSAGAAGNLGHVEPVRGDVSDFTDRNFREAETGKVALGNVGSVPTRFDLAGTMKGSDNPLTAALGSRLVEDAVGNADHSAVNRAVSVEATMIRERQDVFLGRAYQDTWQDFKGRNGIGWLDRAAEGDFRSKVADAIDNLDPTAAHDIDPAVTRMADAMRRNFEDFHDLAQNPGRLDGSEMAPLKGMAEVEKNPNYFPHIYDFLGFGENVRRFGDAQMKGLLRDSILSHVPGMAAEDAERLGKGLFKGLRNVQTGQEVSMSRMLSGDDQEGLRAFLGAETDMGRDAIDRIIAQLNPPKSEGTIARTKRATPINVHFEAPLRDVKTGEVVPVKAKDFMERDAVKVAAMYNRQMSAQVALARLRVENPRWRLGDGPETPRFLVDGIRGPSEMDTLLKRVRAVGDEIGQPREKLEGDVAKLQFVYDAISGRTSSAIDKGALGSFVRILKDYNFMRVMNQTGFPQVAEAWNGVAQVGFKAALSNMPALRYIMDGIRGGVFHDDVMHQLEHMATPGTDLIRGYAHLAVDDLSNVIASDKAQAVEGMLKRGTRLTSIMSGMAPITTYQQKWMAKAALARFAMDATGEKALNAKRLAVLGIDPEMVAKIRGNLQRLDGYVEGASGTKLRVLDLDRWDPDARHALEYGIHTWVRKMIQENDLGQMSMVLGSTMGRLMGQFRMFMFGAYTKNTLHNLHMRDFETVSMVLGTSVFGALTYAAQTYLQSLGRSDQQQFLDRRLNPKALGAAAFSRSAYSSVMPMLADIGTYALGADPLFDNRSSGTPAQGLWSNPSMSLADNVLNASRGITGTLGRGEAYGQRDARALAGALPFGNLLPVVWATNALVRNLPAQDTHKHPN